MAVVGVRIAGVNVKTRFCGCGMRVFDAVAYGAGEVMTFDAQADDDVKEMVAGKDAVFWRARTTPAYRQHFCPIELTVDE